MTTDVEGCITIFDTKERNEFKSSVPEEQFFEIEFDNFYTNSEGKPIDAKTEQLTHLIKASKLVNVKKMAYNEFMQCQFFGLKNMELDDFENFINIARNPSSDENKNTNQAIRQHLERLETCTGIEPLGENTKL